MFDSEARGVGRVDAAGAAKTRILLVDDHPIMRQSLRSLLEREADISICGEAATAVTALQQAADSKPDLALIDVSLPDMNGIALARALHQRYPHLVLAMLSGHDDRGHVEDAFLAGARGYILKGYAAELTTAVRHLMNGGWYRSADLKT
ncbi:MAG: response regulator transcription factor [Pseudomonadales bacterium]